MVQLRSMKGRSMNDTIEYTSWPIGQLPPEFRRPELEQVKEFGYYWSDPRDIVDAFEKKVARFAGSKYAVAVDCDSHAIFLSLICQKRKQTGHTVYPEVIKIPKHTYISVPQQIIHAGFKVEFTDEQWMGAYKLEPYDIWDAAVRWTRDMYLGGFHCVSFQIKKRVPIGRGGMILLDDKEDYEYLKKIRYDGRDLDCPYEDDDFEYLGWHYYMTPEDAARGIILMDSVPKENEDYAGWKNYPDVSKARFLKR